MSDFQNEIASANIAYGLNLTAAEVTTRASKYTDILSASTGRRRTCAQLIRACFGIESSFTPGTTVDYGFMNCRSMDARVMLAGMYSDLVRNLFVDPDALHDACIAGTLASFVTTQFQSSTTQSECFAWISDNLTLLSNPYPL
jgi:hypothetical protein